MASIRRVLRTLANRAIQIASLEVTEQTWIQAVQTQDVNLPADSPQVIPFDQVNEDRLGEFSNGEFIPEESGWYDLQIRGEFAVNSNQDELKLQVYDVDADETITENEVRANGTGNRDRELDSTVELEAGTAYSIRAENSNNNDTLNGKPKRTRLRIKPEYGAP